LAINVIFVIRKLHPFTIETVSQNKNKTALTLRHNQLV